MVLRSGCCVFSQANKDLYISNSLGTLRNAHSDILARPPLAATSAMIGNCKPLSEASPTFFCRMPNRDSATLEQVGPTAIKASLEAIRRTTEMPSSALQRSSRNSTENFTFVPSPSVRPPALLISSAAAFIAASLLMPKTRTTPDFAPKPVIFTVCSCAGATDMESVVPARNAKIPMVRRFMASSLKDRSGDFSGCCRPKPSMLDWFRYGIELSQEEIGHIVGASRQRISQALHALEKASLIKVDYQMIALLLWLSTRERGQRAMVVAHRS